MSTFKTVPTMETTRNKRTIEIEIISLDGEVASRKFDAVVTEEPLELRLRSGVAVQTLAVTMRTPGNDFELAAGFLYSEGILRKRSEIAELTYCLDSAVEPEQRYNIVTVELRTQAPTDLARFERHFTMNSACGVCGRAQLDSLRELGATRIEDDLRLPPAMLYELPQRMRTAQRVFETTGGLHAAALFDTSGTAIAVREDVGRHNAVDKLVGWAALAERLPLGSAALVVSGRVSFEIVQKAAVAGIPVLVAVSAPSSLAVQTARRLRMTLACFVRGTRANLYTDIGRVADLPCPEVASVPERPGATA